jgi:hypothetical protein
MPSFRVLLSVGMLRPGVAPDSVVPAASAAGRELTTVEASELSIVSGAARITIRFTADDAELAQQIATHIAARTGECAEITAWRIVQRVGGRWLPV